MLECADRVFIKYITGRLGDSNLPNQASSNGWVKIHRKIQGWEWYKKSHMFHLFIHLLLSANHADKQWQGITIKRGQVVVGRKSLSLQTGISEQSVRTCINRLKSTKELTTKSTNRFTIITICNYETYQVLEVPSNQQTPNNQPATNQQLTTNKNIKNVKNKRIKTIVPDIFPITESMSSWFEGQGFKNIEIKNETQRFIDYWKSEGKLKADWMATWRNGMRNAEKWSSGKNKEDKSWQF